MISKDASNGNFRVQLRQCSAESQYLACAKMRRNATFLGDSFPRFLKLLDFNPIKLSFSILKV